MSFSLVCTSPPFVSKYQMVCSHCNCKRIIYPTNTLVRKPLVHNPLNPIPHKIRTAHLFDKHPAPICQYRSAFGYAGQTSPQPSAGPLLGVRCGLP